MTQFVVCIHPGPWLRRGIGEEHPNPPKKGQVYTLVSWRETRQGHRMIKLAEISHGWFRAKHFRPVQRDLHQIFTKREELV